MSTMLERAIVDAAKLREAALKNAEAAIIEKYAPEIKNAVESLLEQEMGSPLAPAAPDEVDAPPAYAEGEDQCPCPEDGEQVEVTMTLNLTDLEQMAAELAPTEEPEGHMDVADEVVPDELEDPEDMLEEAHCGQRDDDETLEEEPKPDFLDLDNDGDKKEPMADAAKDKEELEESADDDIVLDEDILAALAEELALEVDINPEMSGWAGRPQAEMDHMAELELVRLAGTEAREKQEALEKAVKSLEESNTNLKKSNKTLKETVLKLKSAFDDMSTSNAKLIYTNRILSSPSLNERQKENIVEAINKAGSVDEAKVIYETLQSTGGTSSKKSVPKSLSEAIKRSSTTVLPRRQPERTTDTAIDRLQILAGIKHNK